MHDELYKPLNIFKNKHLFVKCRKTNFLFDKDFF